MSRHTIPSFDQRYEIVVGWDFPMNTYFAQVIDSEAGADEDHCCVWIGLSFDEIQNPEELRAPIATYGILTDDVIAILRAEGGKTLRSGIL